MFVRGDGVDLCVSVVGDASLPTVVLVHGYPDTKEVWSGVGPRLATDHHVVAYDVRGAGGSSAPAGRQGYAFEHLVADFLAVADAVSPDRPVHLVGHDWGSVQGWEFATSPLTQGRIASFTSISGPSIDHVAHWMRSRARDRNARSMVRLFGQARRSWYVLFFQIPWLPERMWRGPLGRSWGTIAVQREGIPDDGLHPAATIASDGANGVNLYRANIPRRMRRPRPDPVAHVPVQLIVPTGDAFLSPRVYDDLERWAPALRRRTIATRHWAPRTEPEQVAAWIAEWVGLVEAGTVAIPRTAARRAAPSAGEGGVVQAEPEPAAGHEPGGRQTHRFTP